MSQTCRRLPTPCRSSPRPPTRSRRALQRARPTRGSRSSSAAPARRSAGAGRPRAIDVVLDMRRLNRVLAHEHGDLTATIEAGATLARRERRRSRVHGQWLPLDPPFADRATIGGLLATNDSGPLRHRYGTPRDLVIGVQLATTDGVLVEGRRPGREERRRLRPRRSCVTGSFGSLAAIVSATFKLAPLPAASKTMRDRRARRGGARRRRPRDDGEPARAGRVRGARRQRRGREARRARTLRALRALRCS